MIFNEYPQTWSIVSKWPRPIKKFVQFLCGLRGHEWSKTEIGYCGGTKYDAWCRWCNTITRLPADAHPAKMGNKLGLRDTFHDGKE